MCLEPLELWERLHGATCAFVRATVLFSRRNHDRILSMPKKSQGRDKPRESTASGTAPSSRVYPGATQPSAPAMLASPAYAAQGGAPGSHMTRPTLPPLPYLQAGSQYPTSPSSASATSYSGGVSYVALSQYSSPAAPQAFSAFDPGVSDPSSLPIRGSESHHNPPFLGTEHGRYLPPGVPSLIPLKRPYEPPESGFERFVRLQNSMSGS